MKLSPWPNWRDVLRVLPRALGIIALALLLTLGACIGVCSPWNT